MATINDFKAKLSGGGARANQFRVIMAFPSFAIQGNEVEQLSFLCRSASLPASVIGVMQVPFRGRNIPLPTEKEFEPWTITVFNDTNFDLRDSFERWSNAINANSSNEGLTNPADYEVDATVEQLDRNGNVLKSYAFRSIWPSNVGAIELDFENNDAIEQFDVELQLLLWESNTTS